MQLLGKPLTGVCEVSSHDPQVQQMIDGCSFVGSASSPALRFADQQSMEALVFIFNQIGGKTETQVESPEKLILQEKENVDGLCNSISLADSAVKFAVRFFSFTQLRNYANIDLLVRQAILPTPGPSHSRPDHQLCQHRRRPCGWSSHSPEGETHQRRKDSGSG